MPDKHKMIQILLNRNNDLGERDDAAMDLASFPDDDVLKALNKIACDPNENSMVLESSGESIGEILVQRTSLEWDYLKLVTPIAYQAAYSIIQIDRPEWINAVLKE